MNKRFCQTVWAIGLAIAYQHLAWSQSTTYFDRGTFIYACQNLPGTHQTITSWDLLYLPPHTVIRPEVTIGSVTFAGRDIGEGYILPPGYPAGLEERALFNFDSDVPLGIHFPTGARAFGANVSSDVSLYHSSFTATVSLNNGERFSFTAPASPSSRFFGFISPTPFTDITLSDGGIFPISPGVNLHEEMIGDLYMVLVPEPGRAGLLALGAAVLLWRRWKACRT